jgi:undecaprenyl-diphosphatase
VIRALAVALLGATLYALLGIAVAHRPPFGVDLAGRALAGQAPRLALVFTESCWWMILTALSIIAIIGAIRNPPWRGRVTLALVTTLVTWQLSDALKNVFKRPRPDYWILIHEPTYAYSSGHAMFAFLVYWLWAWLFWHSTLPYRLRLTVSVFLALWGCGVMWSRLALGAHYVTDVIGGVLLGATTLAVALAVAAAVRPSTARRR